MSMIDDNDNDEYFLTANHQSNRVVINIGFDK